MAKYLLSALLVLVGVSFLVLSRYKPTLDNFSLLDFYFKRGGDFAGGKQACIANGITYISLGLVVFVLFYLF